MFKKVAFCALVAVTIMSVLFVPRADAATGFWTNEAPLALKNDYNGKVAALSDGRVLSAGGIAQSQAVATAQVYNPATNEWSLTEPMHVPRWFALHAPIAGNRMLVVGAGDAINNTPGHDTFEVFDGASNRWSTSKATPIATSFGGRLTSLANGNALYLDGGAGAVYDASTEGWHTISVPWSSTSSAAGVQALPDNRVLVLSYDYYAPGAPAWVFDVNTEQWQGIYPPQLSSAGHIDTALLGDGRVLAISTTFNNDNTSTSTAAFLTTTSLTWESAPLPASSVRGARLATTPSGDAVLLGGERLEPAGPNSFYVYGMTDTWRLVPTTNTWERQGDLRYGRSFPAVVSVASGILAFAGEQNSLIPRVSELFVTPSALSTVTVHPAVVDEGAPGHWPLLKFTVTLDQPSPFTVQLRGSLTSGSATAGDDFMRDIVDVTIPAGKTSAVIRMRVIGDNQPESDEWFSLTLSGPSVNFATASAIGTIADDDLGACLSLRPGHSTCIGVQNPMTRPLASKLPLP